MVALDQIILRGSSLRAGCRLCGAEALVKCVVLPEYVADAFLGVPGVVLFNAVEQRTCQTCRHETFTVPNDEGLVATVALLRCRDSASLTPKEFRWLRKVLGRTARDFAKATGVNAETVSRWEN